MTKQEILDALDAAVLRLVAQKDTPRSGWLKGIWHTLDTHGFANVEALHHLIGSMPAYGTLRFDLSNLVSEMAFYRECLLLSFEGAIASGKPRIRKDKGRWVVVNAHHFSNRQTYSRQAYAAYCWCQRRNRGAAK